MWALQRASTSAIIVFSRSDFASRTRRLRVPRTAHSVKSGAFIAVTKDVLTSI